MEERLLGFDVRELHGELWDAARRDGFLLRLDVPHPLSVDTSAWPSVFDSGQGIGLPKSERERLRFAGTPLPSWIGPNVGLWDDLERMRRFLAAQRDVRRPYSVLAVSWFSDRGFVDAGQVGPYLGPVTPQVRDLSWPFLGFDVADGSLVSGLSNCGYSDLEAAQLRRQWQIRLNTNHLFADVGHALQFKHLSDQRIPEHAPFFVFGLFTVEERAALN